MTAALELVGVPGVRSTSTTIVLKTFAEHHHLPITAKTEE